MTLPNAARAMVEREKIQDYLPDPAHPDNGGKAQIFDRLGFRADDWKALADAFLSLARDGEVVKSLKSPQGQ